LAEPRLIQGVDASGVAFKNSLKAIKDPQRQRQIREAVRSLLFLDLDQAPAKLHLHQLTGQRAPSCVNAGEKVPVWTIHATPDDRYKVSFTLEDGVAYLRVCGEHDIVDKRP